jgi:hypothetical protein
MEWDVSCSLEAAEHGHVDCLRFALEGGCPWSSRAAGKLRARRFSDEVMAYLRTREEGAAEGGGEART